MRRLALGSVPATVVTLLVLADVGEKSAKAGATISIVLGVTLVLTAVATFFRARLMAWLTPKMGAPEGRRRAGLTIMLGVILGTLVSLTSVGAGALGMTALLVLYPNLPINRLVGSDIAHAVPLTLIAGTGHWLLGSVDGALLASLLVGSVPGVVIGSLVSSRVDERVLRPMLAVVLVIVGIKLAFPA